jgi:hypothetical protein
LVVFALIGFPYPLVVACGWHVVSTPNITIFYYTMSPTVS